MAENKEDLEQNGAEAVSDEDGDAEGTPKKKLSGKKLILLILPVILLLGGGAGAFLLLKPSASTDEADAAVEEQHEPEPAFYYDLPQMLVNLSTAGRRVSFLKIVVSLEITDESDISHLERVLPRIIDNFQVYLRELRIEDLKGSAGIYRLREELLLRVNAAAHPVEIRDVLFKEMLIQ